ncbi:hemagglutinin repeat-containing protein [Rugamonas rubra]|uniref:hemagglutinin repeat-containing protein n=1 Tax=Rugamonas rubra TaxID=758825 RepID=UPI001C2D4E18|nr:hemagglutinin repeat-containing protein [Rugamonas rubra]
MADTGGLIRAAGASVTAGRDIAFNTVQTGGSSEWKASGFTGSSSGVNHQASQLNSSGDLTMKAGRDLALSGTQAAAGGKGVLEAGRALSVAAVKNESRLDVSNDARSKTYDKAIVHDETVAGAAVSAGGDLSLKAGTKETGALSLVASGVAGGGKVELRATGDVAITQLQEEHLLDTASHREWKSTFKKGSSDSADYSASSHVVGSSVTGAGVAVHSGGDIAVTASQLTATEALTLDAGRDLLIASAEQSGSERHSSQVKQSGFSLNLSTGIGYSKSQDDKRGNGDTVRQIGSVLSGGSIAATSGRDTLVKASTVVADGKVSINAKGDLSIVSAADRDTGDYATSSKKSGTIGSNFQPAIGTVKTTTDGKHANSTQVGSQVASLGGDVELTAGGRYTQTASQVKAPGGDIAITAKDVLVNAGFSTSDSSDHTTYAKTAIGGTVSSPLISAVQSVNSMVSAAKNTKDTRMQALAAVNIADTLMSPEALADAGKLANGNLTGLKVSVSLGNSKAESNSVQSARVAVGSTIDAGGSVSIKATGGGNDSNITAVGGDINAGKDVTLIADNKVSLLAAESTASQHSTNNSSGASIGVGFAVGGQQNGFTVDFAVNKARGNADGDDLGHVNSHVNAGNLVVLSSGGDTTLKGGVVAGKTVVANVGGDLKIESLQDRSTYDSKQVSAGLGLSVCVPPACYGMSGSVNYSQSKVKGDYLSVLEQSGITAGDGGFQVNVEGNTDLKGGLMSSSAAAVDAARNVLMTGSLTASELKNKDNYSASGFGVSASVSSVTNKPKDNDVTNVGKPGATGGIGGASGSQASTTLSGISGGLIAILDQTMQAGTGKDAGAVLNSIASDVTTENAADKAGKLGKVWDAAQLQKDMQAQVAITQAFSAQAPKAIAKYADDRIIDIKGQIAKETDPAKVASLNAELVRWDEGGAYRTALHATAGALTGGLSGAAGALTSAASANLMMDLQERAQAALEAQGLSHEQAGLLAQGVAELTSLGVGAVVGGNAGALTALTTDTNNRMLSQNDKLVAKRLAKIGGEKLTEKELLAKEQEILTALRAAGLKDSKGNIIVQEGNRELFVNVNGVLVDPSSGRLAADKLRDGDFGSMRGNGPGTLIEDKPTTPSNELMAFIIANTGGKDSPYVLTPAKTYLTSSSLPPAPPGTTRVSVTVENAVYFPLVASCPAVSCTNGDPIANAIPDAATKAYNDAVARKSEKDFNIVTAVLGVGGAAARGVSTLTELGSATAAARNAVWARVNSSAPNIVYRALTPEDAVSIEAGLGLAAKAPSGTWTAAEHVANAGPNTGGAAANSPWISTSRLLDVAKSYESGNGIVAIDLSKVGSFRAEVWQTAPRVNGVTGIPYFRSIWAQEVTIFQEIPQNAIISATGKK